MERAGPRSGGQAAAPPSPPPQHAGDDRPAAPTDGAAARAPRSTAPEFLRGAAAAATNIIITFPVQKLISRQAYEGLTLRQAARTLQADGLSNLYRGLGPPLMQKGASMGIMYGAYDWYFHQLNFLATGRHDHRAATDVPQADTSWAVRSAAAILAGSTEGLLTPFERMQTILQHRHYNASYANTLDVARKLWGHGLREYYRGFTAILLRNGPSSALFFILREPVKAMIPGSSFVDVGRAAPPDDAATLAAEAAEHIPLQIPVSDAAACYGVGAERCGEGDGDGGAGGAGGGDAGWDAAAAGMDADAAAHVADALLVEGSTTTPAARRRPHLPSTTATPSGRPGGHELPVSGRAVSAAAVTASSAPGATSAVRVHATATAGAAGAVPQPPLHLQPHGSLDFVRHFFAGAVLGAAISTLFYPLNVAKSLMQLQVGGPHASVWATLRRAYVERHGLRGMYHGVAGNAARSMLSWGIINSGYEVYKRVLKFESEHTHSGSHSPGGILIGSSAGTGGLPSRPVAGAASASAQPPHR